MFDTLRYKVRGVIDSIQVWMAKRVFIFLLLFFFSELEQDNLTPIRRLMIEKCIDILRKQIDAMEDEDLPEEDRYLQRIGYEQTRMD